MAAALSSNAPPMLTPYDQLPCILIDQVRIGSVITKTAQLIKNGLLEAVTKDGRELRDQIEEEGALITAHPLKFIDTIFSDKAIYCHMPTIRKSFLAWNRFMNSLIKKIKEVRGKGSFAVYAEPFATKLGIDPAQTRIWMQKGHWNSLMNHLIEIKCPKR